MKIAVQKNNLGGTILYRSRVLFKTASKDSLVKNAKKIKKVNIKNSSLRRKVKDRKIFKKN